MMSAHIVSDRDPRYSSELWDLLVELFGLKLKMASSSHPQTDRESIESNGGKISTVLLLLSSE